MDQRGVIQCSEDTKKTWILVDLVVITKFMEACI
jgi:hypothetical protein